MSLKKKFVVFLISSFLANHCFAFEKGTLFGQNDLVVYHKDVATTYKNLKAVPCENIDFIFTHLFFNHAPNHFSLCKIVLKNDRLITPFSIDAYVAFEPHFVNVNNFTHLNGKEIVYESLERADVRFSSSQHEKLFGVDENHHLFLRVHREIFLRVPQAKDKQKLYVFMKGKTSENYCAEWILNKKSPKSECNVDLINKNRNGDHVKDSFNEIILFLENICGESIYSFIYENDCNVMFRFLSYISNNKKIINVKS